MEVGEQREPDGGLCAAKSVESMTLTVPLTAVPAAAVGDNVAVSCPVSPAASSAGVAALPPLMSRADADSSKNPAWFVVFVTVTVIGTPEPEPKPEGPHRPRTAMSCLLRTKWHRT